MANESYDEFASSLQKEYEEDGIRVRAVLDEENFGRLKAWIPGLEEPKEDWET